MTMKFESVDQILDFAIGKEEEAAQFYTGLAGKSSVGMKKVFLGFADEEKGHKAKLERVKEGKQLVSSEQQVLDLKIGDHLVEIDTDRELTYQEALIVAMKAEKNAYVMYNSLAQATTDAGLKDLFMGLAAEEAKHKLRFEVEYDDVILTEN